MLYHKERVYHKESVTPPAQEHHKGVFFMASFFLCRQEGQCIGIPMLPLGQVFIAYIVGHYRVHKGKEGARKIHPTSINIAVVKGNFAEVKR